MADAVDPKSACTARRRASCRSRICPWWLRPVVLSPAGGCACAADFVRCRRAHSQNIARFPSADSQLRHYQPAIHTEHVPGDETGTFVGQEGHGPRHFLGRPHAADRRAGQNRALLFVGQDVGERGRDEAGATALTMMLRLATSREALGEADDPGLARRVVGLPRLPGEPTTLVMLIMRPTSGAPSRVSPPWSRRRRYAGWC